MRSAGMVTTLALMLTALGCHPGGGEDAGSAGSGGSGGWIDPPGDCLAAVTPDPACGPPLDWVPVCGCDGRTYETAATAGCWGINRYVDGICESEVDGEGEPGEPCLADGTCDELNLICHAGQVCTECPLGLRPPDSGLPCQDWPCANAGTCTNAGAIVRCNCTPGFVGAICEASSGAGDGTFGAPLEHDLPVGLPAISVATLADVDGDGRVDLIFVGADGTAVLGVALSNGDGSFAPPTSNALNSAVTGDNREDFVLLARDLDGDSDLDVVMASVTWGKVALFVNGGGGLLTPGPELDSGVSGTVNTLDVEAADLTGDGLVDIAMGLSYDSIWGASKVYVATAPLEFAAPISGTSGPRDLVAVEINGDGINDLLDARAGTVRLGASDGPRGAVYLGVWSSLHYRHLAVADVDGDGDVDLISFGLPVVGEVPPGPPLSTVLRVHSNIGECDFLAGPAIAELGPLAPAFRGYVHGGLVVTGDVNGDGAVDILVGDLDLTRAEIRVFIGGGDGTFVEIEPVSLTGTDGVVVNPDVLLGDVDGDGILDLVEHNVIAGPPGSQWRNRVSVRFGHSQ